MIHTAWDAGRQRRLQARWGSAEEQHRGVRVVKLYESLGGWAIVLGAENVADVAMPATNRLIRRPVDDESVDLLLDAFVCLTGEVVPAGAISIKMKRPANGCASDRP